MVTMNPVGQHHPVLHCALLVQHAEDAARAVAARPAGRTALGSITGAGTEVTVSVVQEKLEAAADIRRADAAVLAL